MAAKGDHLRELLRSAAQGDLVPVGVDELEARLVGVRAFLADGQDRGLEQLADDGDARIAARLEVDRGP
eukprot:4614691-Pyramimonas_sp.AAC.1